MITQLLLIDLESNCFKQNYDKIKKIYNNANIVIIFFIQEGYKITLFPSFVEKEIIDKTITFTDFQSLLWIMGVTIGKTEHTLVNVLIDTTIRQYNKDLKGRISDTYKNIKFIDYEDL